MAVRSSEVVETSLKSRLSAWWHDRKVTCQSCRKTYQLETHDEVDIFGNNPLYAAGRFRCRHCDTWNALDRPTS